MRWLEYTIFLAIVVGLVKPVGLYVARVFERKPTFLDRTLCPVETMLYRLFRIEPEREMSASVYILCFILFTTLGTVVLFAVLLLQKWLPGGPHDRYLTTPMTVDLAANTAVSFATTTTWQAYGGETTLRYLAQILGLVAQNFLAGAAGLAAGIAFIRGFARERSATIGNFWVDVVRATLWVLLPIALLGSLALIWQGVPFNLAPYTQARTLEGQLQSIAQGPVAALEFIKNLGTNGGGFFNANGAHPYANPTPLTNFLGLLAIAVLPASLTFTFGFWTNRRRSGWMLLGVMVMIFTFGLAVCDFAEKSVPSNLNELNVSGGNMEGKEVRFGVGGSVLATVVTFERRHRFLQFDDRFVRTAGRYRAANEYALGRDRLRRLGNRIAEHGHACPGRRPARRAHGWTNSRIFGQSDHPFGSEAAGVVRAVNSVRSFNSVQLGDQHRHGPGRARHQYGAACFDGSGVRLRLQYGQQRDDHGRPKRQQRLLQYDHGLGDVGRTLWLGRLGSSPRRPLRRSGPPANHSRNLA